MLFLFSSARKLYPRLPSFPSFVRASGVTFFKFFFQTIPDKNVGTWSKFSPPPTFNVDNPVIFFPFCSKKRDIFQHWLGGKRDTWYSSSVETTFGRDCSLLFGGILFPIVEAINWMLTIMNASGAIVVCKRLEIRISSLCKTPLIRIL